MVFCVGMGKEDALVARGEKSRKIQDLLFPAVLHNPLHYHHNHYPHLLLLLDLQHPNHQVSLAGRGVLQEI